MSILGFALHKSPVNANANRSILTQPNMYARGILFGKMKYELGDHSFVRCPELDLVADVDFKTKGWVGGTYNAIGGSIKRESTGEVLYELSGLWSEEMFIKDVRVRMSGLPCGHALTGSRRVTEKCSSMLPTRSLPRHSFVQSPSKKSGSRNGYGKRLPRR